EHGLERRLRHTAANGQTLLPILLIAQPLPVPTQILITLLEQLLPPSRQTKRLLVVRRRLEHALDAVLFLQPMLHPPQPLPAVDAIAEQRFRHFGHVAGRVIVVPNPLPLQTLPGPWMTQPRQHL